MKTGRKRVVAAAFLLLLSAVPGYRALRGNGQEEEQYVYLEETVLCGNLAQGITESGSVLLQTVSQDYELTMGTEEESGESEEEEDTKRYLMIEEVYKAPGEWVAEGDPVYRLQEKSVASVRRVLQALVTEAEIALEEAETEYEKGILTAEGVYRESILKGETAETEYQIACTVTQKEIEASAARVSILEQEIRQLEEDLEDGWEDYDDLREAYEEAEYEFEHCSESAVTKYISLRDVWLEAKKSYESVRDERLDMREQMKEKQEEIQEIQKETASLLEKTEGKELEARQNYESAALEQELAEEVYNCTAEELSQGVTSAKTELARAKESLEAFEAFAGDGMIYAEGGGMVTAVTYEAGDFLGESGSLFTYVPEGNYYVSVDVPEEDIPELSVGDKAAIVFDAYEDRYWNGTVSAIETSASPDYAATVSYPVTVRIEGETSDLYGGMSGNVTFVTEQAENVLYVSRRAVVEENGKSYVYTKDGEEMRLKEVATGFTDGIGIQITEGLSEGDTVYLRSRAAGGMENESDSR